MLDRRQPLFGLPHRDHDSQLLDVTCEGDGLYGSAYEQAIPSGIVGAQRWLSNYKSSCAHAA